MLAPDESSRVRPTGAVESHGVSHEPWTSALIVVVCHAAWPTDVVAGADERLQQAGESSCFAAPKTPRIMTAVRCSRAPTGRASHRALTHAQTFLHPYAPLDRARGVRLDESDACLPRGQPVTSPFVRNPQLSMDARRSGGRPRDSSWRRGGKREHHALRVGSSAQRILIGDRLAEADRDLIASDVGRVSQENQRVARPSEPCEHTAGLSRVDRLQLQRRG